MIKKSIKVILLLLIIINFLYFSYIETKELNMKYTEKIIIKNEKNYNVINQEHIGILRIEKIKLEKIFYDKYNSKNNIEENITIMKESNMPNITNGNLIIGAHSGSGYIAFFNDLNKLEKGDIASVEYQGKEYIYQIENKYLDDRNGKITIRREKDKNTLTLFTCNNNDKNNYLVIIAYKIKVNEEKLLH